MDHVFSFPANALATIFVSVLFLYALKWMSKTIPRAGGKKKEAPEAGGSWPVIGHLHLLGASQPLHIILGHMADKYGPIFTIRMGVHRALVVSNREIAKECLTTNDKAFASRPHTVAMDLLGYNSAMLGLSPYGPYWRQMRKIVTLELLSNHQVEMFRHARESETKASLKELYKLWNKNKSINSNNNEMLVEMKRWFGDITLNVIFKIIVGKSVGYSTKDEREESDDGWKKALRDFFDYLGMFVVADALPFLRWLDIGGHEKAMKKIAKELDQVAEGWIEEHKQKRACGEAIKGEEDFMDLMLNILEDQEVVPAGQNSDTINKVTCLSLILAGSDTTTVTLTWALSLLVNNPNALKKAQQELDLQVGRQRLVQESDLKDLVYLQAIVKETLRLYPAGPLSVPHESTEDCIVAGYNIPAGTQLFVNLSKIHRDLRVWSDPDEFQPERFLTTHKDVDFKGQNFEFMPFGSGRRMCPGVAFAQQVVQLTLAILIHGFDFATPSGEPIDMTESIGLTNMKVTPLEILLSPRLQPHLYQ